MKLCKWCDSGLEVKPGNFRCDKCAESAIMNPKKKNMPISETRWKNANGNYVPKPSG